MEFIELYNRIIDLWPEKIDISDGYPAGQGGFMFPTLSRIHYEIEKSIDHEKDHWGNIGVWAFFQAFHETAKMIKADEGKTLNTRIVPKELIDKKVESNLAPSKWGDDWADLRREYRRLA